MIRLQNLEQRVVASVDRLLGFPREKKRFEQAHGYRPDLDSPRSLNEKIVWKKLFDRSALLPKVADKLLLPTYIEEKLGPEEARRLCVPVLWSGRRAQDIPFDSLPDQFVLKSNHGSGNNLIVSNKKDLDREETIRTCRKWLIEEYGLRNHEWAYTAIERKLFIEPMLVTSDGYIPPDYKFSMIHGECAFIQVDQDRHGEFSRSLFSPDWEYLDVAWKRQQGESLPRPGQLDDMHRIARVLAADFDYVRVDFYSFDSSLFVGELTHYPARGRGRFEPATFDFEIGSHWKLTER